MVPARRSSAGKWQAATLAAAALACTLLLCVAPLRQGMRNFKFKSLVQQNPGGFAVVGESSGRMQGADRRWWRSSRRKLGQVLDEGGPATNGTAPAQQPVQGNQTVNAALAVKGEAEEEGTAAEKTEAEETKRKKTEADKRVAEKMEAGRTEGKKKEPEEMVADKKNGDGEGGEGTEAEKTEGNKTLTEKTKVKELRDRDMEAKEHERAEAQAGVSRAERQVDADITELQNAAAGPKEGRGEVSLERESSLAHLAPAATSLTLLEDASVTTEVAAEGEKMKAPDASLARGNPGNSNSTKGLISSSKTSDLIRHNSGKVAASFQSSAAKLSSASARAPSPRGKDESSLSFSSGGLTAALVAPSLTSTHLQTLRNLTGVRSSSLSEVTTLSNLAAAPSPRSVESEHPPTFRVITPSFSLAPSLSASKPTALAAPPAAFSPSQDTLLQQQVVSQEKATEPAAAPQVGRDLGSPVAAAAASPAEAEAVTAPPAAASPRAAAAAAAATAAAAAAAAARIGERAEMANASRAPALAAGSKGGFEKGAAGGERQAGGRDADAEERNEETLSDRQRGGGSHGLAGEDRGADADKDDLAMLQEVGGQLADAIRKEQLLSAGLSDQEAAGEGGEEKDPGQQQQQQQQQQTVASSGKVSSSSGPSLPWEQGPELAAELAATHQQQVVDSVVLEAGEVAKISVAARGGMVILCSCHKGQLDLLPNWVAAVEQAGLGDRFVIFAQDEPTLDFASARYSDRVIQLPLPQLQHRLEAGVRSIVPLPEEQKRRALLAAQQPYFVKAVLGLGISVLFCDVNTILVHTPLPFLVGDFDLFVASSTESPASKREAASSNDTGPFEPSLIGSFCACFFFFKPADETRMLISDWMIRMRSMSFGGPEGNRRHFNLAIDKLFRSGNLHHAALIPMGSLVTEVAIGDRRPAIKTSVGASSVAVQVSWKGRFVSRAEYLRDIGLWYSRDKEPG